MNRHEAREQAFFFLFEKIFNDTDIDDIISSALLARNIETDNFSRRVFKGVNDNIEKIDGIIEKHSIGWKKDRIPKVSVSVLRLAIFEMLHEDNIPASVSINEAVELAKTYSTEKDASFVNGLLSSVYKELNTAKEDTPAGAEE